jgi:glucose-6-phosphate 1-epimerase
MNDAVALNEQFSIPGELAFRVGDHGALVAEITNAGGSGSVAIQGAQILSWAPAGQTPVVWLSSAARFAPGKSLRGGAPVCWPWFGPHPEDPAKPAHGFARNLDWTVLETGSTDSATRLVMGLTPGETQRALWPHAAELTLTLTLGQRLRAELTTRNTGDAPVELTQALHTYFRVGDIAEARVHGLDGCEYIDKVGPEVRRRQEGPIAIAGEVNRIYLGCPGGVVIRDASLRREIRISKQGSASYVVWNPWAEQGAKFGDMGEDGYRHMLCVETTNAASDTVTVQPGDTCRLITEYAVEGLA